MPTDLLIIINLIKQSLKYFSFMQPWVVLLSLSGFKVVGINQ